MDPSLRSQSRRPPIVSRLSADPYVWVLAVVPLYILFVSSNWIFSPPQSIDPWVYHGFFRNLQEYKTALFPGTYYGSRLSWILPGYLLYKFLPPLAANYVLHLGLWYTAVFALYYTLASTASRQVGLVAAVFLGSYIHFLYPVGSDYVDGPANVYLLVCFALLTAATLSERRRLTLLLAGASYAAVLYTNLFTIILAPVVALYFVLLSHRSHRADLKFQTPGATQQLKPLAGIGTGLNRQGDPTPNGSPRASTDQPIRRSTLRATILMGLSSLAWFLAGSAALTVLLGCANLVIEGSFQFYMPSVYYVLGHIGQPNPWKLPVAQWLRQAEWLVLPLVAAVSALVALASSRFRESLAGPAAASAFLLAVLLLMLCEWRGIPVLQYSYYASYLIPPAFLAVGAVLQRPLEGLTPTAALSLAFAALAIVTVPLWGHNAHLSQLKADAWPVTPLLFGMVFAACRMLPGKGAGWGMTAALAGCLVTSASTGYAFAERHVRRDSFARITQAADTVDAVRRNEFPWFWYSNADPHFDEFHALHSIYLWGYTMIGAEFPGIKPDAVIVDESLVVIPSSGEEVLSCANQALHPRIFSADLVDHRQITEGGASYSLSFVRVKFDSARLEPLELRPCESGICSKLASQGESAPAQLPLDKWIQSPVPQTSLRNTPEGVYLTTALTRDGYAAKYGPLVAETAGRFVFKLQYLLSKGGIAFGAKPTDQSRWLGRASIPVSQPGERTAVLSLEAEPGEPFWLMISNDHPLGDHASQYLILELEAYRFPAEDAVARR